MSDIFKVKSNNQWIGLNAMVGPQGPQGIQGPAGQDGHDGIDGHDGTSAGFGIPTASASSLQPGTSPTVSVTASGPDTAKVFDFSFGIPNSGVVQADWNESDTSATDYIKNKPTIPSAQVNSDWNSSSGVSEILNKPDLTLKEDVSNKVTSISSSSTDTEYPSAKCVYDAIQAGGGGSGNVSSYIISGTNPINVNAKGMSIGDLRIYTVYIAGTSSSGSVTLLFSVDSGRYAYGTMTYGTYENYNGSNVTSITYVKQATTGNGNYYQINLLRIA